MKMENAKVAFVTFDSADVITTSTSGELKSGAWWGYEGDLKELSGNASVQYNEGQYLALFTPTNGWAGDDEYKWGINAAKYTTEPEEMNFLLGEYIENVHTNQVVDNITLQQALEWLVTNTLVNPQ